MNRRKFKTIFKSYEEKSYDVMCGYCHMLNDYVKGQNWWKCCQCKRKFDKETGDLIK